MPSNWQMLPKFCKYQLKNTNEVQLTKNQLIEESGTVASCYNWMKPCCCDISTRDMGPVLSPPKNANYANRLKFLESLGKKEQNI